MDFSEKNLYEPVKNYLENLGYEVRGEVKTCDLVAIKDDEIVVVELKKAFNLKLIYQVIQRQTFSSCVYVCIPRQKDNSSANYKNMINLLKRLDVGLLTVAIESPTLFVQEELSPSYFKARNKKKKDVIIKEFQKRKTDSNLGGVTRAEIITGYKEKAIEMLCLIEKYETLKTKDLKNIGYGSAESNLISRNYYKWFEKVEKGTYCLSEQGKEALTNPKYDKVVAFYKKNIKFF